MTPFPITLENCNCKIKIVQNNIINTLIVDKLRGQYVCPRFNFVRIGYNAEIAAQNKIFMIKMKKYCLFKYSCLLLFCLGICSCDDTDSSEDSSLENLSPIIVEAMNYLKTTDLSLPDMHQTLCANTRSATDLAKQKSSAIAPDWSTLQTYCDEYEDVRLFQLEENTKPLSGFVYTRVKGKVERLLSVTTSKLALWKINGKLVGRIITYIPNRKFLKDGHKIAELGYKLEGSTYTGLCLVSTLDGTFLYGDKYDRGRHVFHFISNQQQVGNLKTRSAALPDKDSVCTDHIYIALFSESDAVQPQLAYSTVEEDDFTCSFCNRPASQCTCVIITPGGGTAYCPLCGAEIGHCGCFNNGGNIGGNTEGSESTSGESGGGSSIGGGSTGGGSTGGDSSGEEGFKPTSPNQRTTEEIKKSASDAVDKVLSDHNNDKITAHCNEGVRNAFYNLYKTKILYNMRANDMVKYWKNNPAQWESIRMAEAQRLANQGYFVVAGWINAKGSGHVCLIVPGKEVKKNWNGISTYIPVTMDTGYGMRSKSQPINKSFGKNKHNEVVFFKYK